MIAVMRVAAWLLATYAAAAFAQPASAQLTAAEIVARNATARGGVEAWRQIRTMAWSGRVESANAPGRHSTFLLEQQRPGSSRFEVVAQGQKFIRAFDGAEGWKLHPNGAGKPELESYSADELAFSRGAQVIDGPLMAYAGTGGWRSRWRASPKSMAARPTC